MKTAIKWVAYAIGFVILAIFLSEASDKAKLAGLIGVIIVMLWTLIQAVGRLERRIDAANNNLARLLDRIGGNN